jgi:hypothetical protein
MGFSHSWIAVQGLAPEQALATLELEIAAESGNGFWNGISLLAWPDGWLLVLSDDDENAFKGRLARLAVLGSAVACSINERVMYSEARGYAAGEQIWRVVHDPNGDESLYSLQISGTPPEQLEAIVRDARAEQDAEGGDKADVDVIFDVPPKLAQSICGFMLGEGDPDEIRYSALQPIGGWPVPAAKPGFFARLFGRS